MLDYRIENALLIDGSGRPGIPGSLGVKNGKIAALGRLDGETTAQRIDAKGRCLTPGFLDIHRHADAALFRPGFGRAELAQGLTTIVNGNCGLSLAPAPCVRRREIYGYLEPVTGLPDDALATDTMAAYLDAVGKTPLPIHIGMLAGGGTVRTAAYGFAPGPLAPEALREVHRLLEESLSGGALGISLGLGYAPECFYTTQELIAALAPLRDSGVPITVHMRQEGSGVEQALEEMIAVGKALRTPVEISHLKSIGKTNWRRSTPNMLRRMELAREEGVEIYCDAYPYTAGSTQLIHILPPECQEGGLGVLSENLREPSFRAHIRHRMETGSDFENISLLVGWENIVASSVTLPQHKCFEGKTIAQIAAMEQKDPFDCAFDLLADEHCAVSMIDFITAEEDIEAILRDETTCVISDSTYPTQGLVHPRVYGTYVRLFERYVRRGVLSPEQAVRKVTALPAARLRLPGKGMLAPGMDADVNVFALEGLHEAGTYGNPRQSAQGMEQVFLAGEPAILHGERTDNICGKVLERVKS